MLKHGWFPEFPTLGTLASQLLQFLLDPRHILGTDPVGLGAAARCLVIPLCSASHLTIVLGLLPSFLGYSASTRPDLLVALTPSHIPVENINSYSTPPAQGSFLNIDYHQKFS